MKIKLKLHQKYRHWIEFSKLKTIDDLRRVCLSVEAGFAVNEREQQSSSFNNRNYKPIVDKPSLGKYDRSYLDKPNHFTNQLATIKPRLTCYNCGVEGDISREYRKPRTTNNRPPTKAPQFRNNFNNGKNYRRPRSPYPNKRIQMMEGAQGKQLPLNSLVETAPKDKRWIITYGNATINPIQGEGSYIKKIGGLFTLGLAPPARARIYADDSISDEPKPKKKPGGARL